MELGIVAQKGNERAAAVATTIVEALADSDVDTRLDEATAEAIGGDGVPTAALGHCPLVVSVGGDGTFLYVARHLGSTPILGVNLGEVGFLNAVSPEEAVDAVHEEVDFIRDRGHPRFREVPRLVGRGDDWSLPPALNEIGIFGPQRGRGRGLDVEIRVDEAVFTAVHADGVLVATPTGSTAYNLAEGGPLVHPSVGSLIVTTMSPASPTPPLVIDRDSIVDVHASGADVAIIASDGSARTRGEPPCTVSIAVAREPARIAGPNSEFFRALEKLAPTTDDDG